MVEGGFDYYIAGKGGKRNEENIVTCGGLGIDGGT